MVSVYYSSSGFWLRFSRGFMPGGRSSQVRVMGGRSDHAGMVAKCLDVFYRPVLIDWQYFHSGCALFNKTRTKGMGLAESAERKALLSLALVRLCQTAWEGLWGVCVCMSFVDHEYSLLAV